MLTVNGDKYLGHSGQTLLKFSSKCRDQIMSTKERGYELKRAKAGFIVYWLKEGASEEVQIVLPELYFERICS